MKSMKERPGPMAVKREMRKVLKSIKGFPNSIKMKL